jgi:sugar phosphate isomerase/epimerase
MTQKDIPAISRRSFLRTSIAAAGVSAMPTLPAGTKKKEIGLYIPLSPERPETSVTRVRELGFSFAEFYCEDFRPDLADRLTAAMKRNEIRSSGLIMLGPGDTAWNFVDGPDTIGLVPREFRRPRIEAMKRASDFCARCGIPALETHVGFIPENPKDVLYGETVAAVKEVVRHCRGNGQTFLFHAGQETPTTLVRMIEDVGLDNQGIGLDTGNLIMYDKGHPLHALDIYGKHLKTVNAKDGAYPTDTRELGREVQIGLGAVNFHALFAKLAALKFEGPVIVERESSGAQWAKDVTESRNFLQKLLL